MDEMDDNIDNECKIRIHFCLPKFFNEFKMHSKYTEKLSTIRENSRVTLTISFKKVMDDSTEQYHTKVIMWKAASLFTNTVSRLKFMELMKGKEIDMNDIEHIIEDPDLKEKFHLSDD